MMLMDFQNEAVDKLSKTFITLWETGEYQIPLIFKAPTGAGKTIMMADFLRTLDGNYHFDYDKAYIWISFGGDESYMQSKEKLYKYYNCGTDMTLRDKNDLSLKELPKNNIFFINWSKIKSSTKDGKVLRKDCELTGGDYGIFDEFIINTKNKRDLILIIDEAHTETNTTLASEVIDLINPRIIIKVTATPLVIPNADDIENKKAGYVSVKEEDVIASGLIKKSIIIQTEEEISNIKLENLDEDEMMIELAIKKRDELKKLYEDMSLDINPLILIQLPSEIEAQEDLSARKKDVVINYLHKCGIQPEKIAIWLDKEKSNLDFITINNSDVDFMLFKVAPATGWDCPRASILVMYREIKNPRFHTQIIGRVKRMPEAKHYQNEILNKAYIYTNYNKSHLANIPSTDPNKPSIYFPKIKENIRAIKLESTYFKRIDFNTLTPENEWQAFAHNKLDEHKAEIEKKVNLVINEIPNTIIINATVSTSERFMEKLREQANETSFSYSDNDIEKIYNNLCFTELENQDDEKAKYNTSRSWSPLKKALNVWFNKKMNFGREAYYKIIVNDMIKDDSYLKIVIKDALVGYRELLDKQLEAKENKEIGDVIIPPCEQSYTDDYEAKDTTKNVYDIFYIKKSYLGKDNEVKFIDFVDNNSNVLWWHKQNDSGKESFAIEYFDTQEQKHRLFYPDFMVTTNNNILYIIDTKNGTTAKSTETKDKAEALQKWIKENQKNYDFKIVGGIVVFEHPSWKINANDEYNYSKPSEWQILTF